MKTINKMFFYLKIFLLLISFSFSLYIAFMKMDYMSSNILAVLPTFIPFLVLLIIFVISMFNNKDNKLYYNIVSTLAFIGITIITFRTIFDKNIIAYPAQININFYNAQEGKIKLLLYLMILGNIILLYYQRKRNKENIISNCKQM